MGSRKEGTYDVVGVEHSAALEQPPAEITGPLTLVVLHAVSTASSRPIRTSTISSGLLQTLFVGSIMGSHLLLLAMAPPPDPSHRVRCRFYPPIAGASSASTSRRAAPIWLRRRPCPGSGGDQHAARGERGHVPGQAPREHGRQRNRGEVVALMRQDAAAAPQEPRLSWVALFGPQVELKPFGSAARGDDLDHSDSDVLVLLPGHVDHALEERVFDAVVYEKAFWDGGSPPACSCRAASRVKSRRREQAADPLSQGQGQ